MNTPKILFFDIETTPLLMWGWSTGQQYVTAEQILEDSRITSISWIWDHKKDPEHLTWSRDQSDYLMLKKFVEIANTADLLIGHNGENFDVRHINVRLAKHNLPQLNVRCIEDTLKQTRKAFRLPSYKLSYLVKYFKVGQKMDVSMQVWLDVWLNNDRKQLATMVERSNSDCIILKKLYNRIKPYITTKFNHAIFQNKPVCPSCGTDRLIKHKIKITRAGKKQQYQCTWCGKYHTDGKNLIQNVSSLPR